MRVLILGSTGFLGRLLAHELGRAGHAVEGWSRGEDEGASSYAARRVDLAGEAPLPVPREPWDAVVLLAGRSVPARFDAARDTGATLAIARRSLEHAAHHAPRARVVVASSAHVLRSSDARLDESAPFDPISSYGAAKLGVEAVALGMAPSGLDVRIARIFGSLGPGLPAGLFVPDLLAQLDARPASIRLAGPDARRDLTDGRDVARALRALIELPEAPERVYHVGTGRAVTLSRVAHELAARHGYAGTIAFAPGAGSTWIADAGRLERATGWRPDLELEASLDWTAELAFPGRARERMSVPDRPETR